MKKRGIVVNKARPYPDKTIFTQGPQRSYTGENLDQIAFPLGGIGAGSVCLGGSGYLTDVAFFQKPNLGAPHYAFAALHVQGGGQKVTRLLEGPVPTNRIFNGGRWANGSAAGYEGLPRCQQATFRGEFPFASIDFKEPSLPLTASLRAWSPFIPLDDKHSGMPLAILEYTLSNKTKKPVKGLFAYVMRGPNLGGTAAWRHLFRQCPAGSGIQYWREGLEPTDPQQGSFVLGTTAKGATADCAWFRGGGFDGLTIFWRDFSAGRVTENLQSRKDDYGKNPATATLYVPFSLKAGAKITIPLVMTWYYPNNPLRSGQPQPPAAPAPATECSCGGKCDKPADPLADPARPWYSTQWKGAWEIASYTFENYQSLQGRTEAFHNAFFSTTAPSNVLDAVSANLAILRSPTVLRQANGTVWAWEGCGCQNGCCAGSCTHVWNYAQAMPHLFPPLERTLRENEYNDSMDDRGHVTFRSAYPEGPVKHDFHAAADGQLGGVMKLYREWMISGDDDWLRRYYPKARQSLDYCIASWDPKREGWLVEPHHNTYDIEFWGPDGMCTSFYLGALRAIAEMGRRLGEDITEYEALLQHGRKHVEEELYNGEYYFQKIQWQGLSSDPAVIHGVFGKYAPEASELLKAEGPRYQYGNGCLADGVLGQWHTTLYGLGDVLDRDRTRRHLQAVFEHNFRPSLRDHVNPQRGTYALNDDGGLLLCTWPRGGNLSLPFIYCNEVWTGFEYQAASHMIYEGLVAEGLTIVQAARDRHDGRRRNPWNEYECGNYYARAMSSYALLTSLFGFRYDRPQERLTLAPRLKDARQSTFFSTAGGWGTISLQQSPKGLTVTINVVEGALSVRELRFEAQKGLRPTAVTIEGIERPATIATQGGYWIASLSSSVTAKPSHPLVLCFHRG